MEAKKPKEINYRKTLAEYWSILGKSRKILLLLVFLMALSQGFSIANQLLFKELVDKGTAFSSGGLIDSVFISEAYLIILVFLAVALSSAIANWIRMNYLVTLESDLSLRIKQKYFGHILELDYEFHANRKTGAMVSRFIRASGAINQFTETIVFSFSPLVMQFLILMPLLFQLGSIYLAILMGVCVTFLIYSLSIAKKLRRDKALENEMHDIERARISDVFTNMDSVKYFGKNDLVKSDFMSLAEKTKKAQIKSGGWWKWMTSGNAVIVGLGAATLLYFSINQFVAGTITLGTLVFLYTTYYGIIGPLYDFSQGIRSSTISITDMQDLFEYQNVEKKVNDRPKARPIEINSGGIEFRNISFGFEKECLFNDFDLKIDGGKTVALVGHSGCGKTTIIKLLYRLYDVPKGAILVDGQDVREVTQESLRSEMSIVPQESILFDDTIYNNILFSRPEASREQVMEAMKFSQLDKFVENLPEKDQTIVGERGIKLSGGEKQRIAIARAILANKKILVLDEATSSLDSRTESEIQKDLENLMKGRTTIIIAHRLSTIMNADEILVMSKGKIVQRGTHEELLKQGGEYKALWDLQKGGYIP